MSTNYEDRGRGYNGDEDMDRGRGMPGGRGGRRIHRRRICRFCIEKVDLIDFKDIRLLQNYISELLGKERSRECSRIGSGEAIRRDAASHFELAASNIQHELIL